MTNFSFVGPYYRVFSLKMIARYLEYVNVCVLQVMCKDYQHGKQVLAAHLKQKGYGSWLHLPAEISKFSK